MVYSTLSAISLLSYRPVTICLLYRNSTETAVTKVSNDLLTATPNCKYSLLILLDLSAVFNTVDNQLLFSRLYSLGLKDTCLSWFSSYLPDHLCSASFAGFTSSPFTLGAGIL